MVREVAGEKRRTSTVWASPTLARIIDQDNKKHPIWTIAERVKEKMRRLSNACLVPSPGTA